MVHNHLKTTSLAIACLVAPLATMTVLDTSIEEVAPIEWIARIIYSALVGTMIYAATGRLAGQIGFVTAMYLLYGAQLALMIAAFALVCG